MIFWSAITRLRNSGCGWQRWPTYDGIFCVEAIPVRTSTLMSTSHAFTLSHFLKKVEKRQLWVRPFEWLKPTLQAAWYIRRVRIMWFLWTKPTIWLILSFTQNIYIKERSVTIFLLLQFLRSLQVTIKTNLLAELKHQAVPPHGSSAQVFFFCVEVVVTLPHRHNPDKIQ